MKQVGAAETAAESFISFFTCGYSDYNRLDTSFIIANVNVYTELKPQRKVSHDINYPAFTPYTTFY